MLKKLRLIVTLAIILSSTARLMAQENTDSSEQAEAAKRLLHTIKTQHFYSLNWHDLKTAAGDPHYVKQLKIAVSGSMIGPAGIKEQMLWIDAAAGHPEAMLSFYDNNIKMHPDDITLPNAACWARADRGFDLQNALSVCNAAVAADPKGYTFVSKGKAELQLGLNSGALADFQTALSDPAFRTHPFRPDAVYGRGIARLRLGDDGGQKDIKLAKMANPDVAIKFADVGVRP